MITESQAVEKRIRISIMQILFEWHEVLPYVQFYNFNLKVDASRKKIPFSSAHLYTFLELSSELK